jgi:hypothetical protein
MKLKNSLILLLIILFTGNNFAADSLYHPAPIEKRLDTLFDDLAVQNTLKIKNTANKKIIKILDGTLKDTNSFYYTFNSVENLGVVTSLDSLLRIYSWNIPHKGGLHEYFGYIQYYSPPKNNYSVFPLKEHHYESDSIEKIAYPHTKWDGMLYYTAIPFAHNDTTFYLLLGLDFNDLFTTKKILDVLYIDNNTCIFGKPLLINKEGDKKHRMVFEYSSRVVMTVRYDKRRKMVVYDHIVPETPKFLGHYEYYGPSGYYNGLSLKDGLWYVIENITPSY